MTETQPKKSDFSECLLLQMTKIAGYGGASALANTPPYPRKVLFLKSKPDQQVPVAALL